MPPVTNQMLQTRREKHCTSISLDRKFFKVDKSIIKRSLRPCEWQHNHISGTLYIPRLGNERILNEGASLRFIAKHTNILVPELYACFEDDEATYLITEYVEGVELADLTPDQRGIVQVELEGYLKTLGELKSKDWGGSTGIVIPPYRVMSKSARPYWKMKPRETEDLVFCHGDFSAHNIIVDPGTLKVKAVIDWEYAGFFPKEFEGMFFRRPGPSVALSGERDDAEELLDIMLENVVPFWYTQYVMIYWLQTGVVVFTAQRLLTFWIEWNDEAFPKQECISIWLTKETT